MTHGPGTVVVPCQEQARYHRFTVALAELKQPEDSRLVLGVGTSIVDNLNAPLRSLRDQDEWVWFMGDDHIFAPDTLIRLLDRDVDIIAPLCVGRRVPFPLLHYDGKIAETEFFHTIQFEDLPDEPFEVEATGSAMLVKRHVLDVLGDPWFRNSTGRMNEDLDFCTRARRAGFKVLVDPQVTIGHIGNLVAWPTKKDGVWGLLLDLCGQSLFLPGGVKEGSLGELEAALS